MGSYDAASDLFLCEKDHVDYVRKYDEVCITYMSNEIENK